MFSEEIQKKLDKRKACAALHGFTHEYQNAREQEDNTICHKQLAPATLRNYENTVLNWALWRLSRNEAANANFSKKEPDSIPQLLKSFAEDYIATRKRLFLQKSVCLNFINFTSRWEREISRILPGSVKEDVLNYIRQDLTVKYKLATKPRERYMVMAKDIDYFFCGLFGNNWYNYRYKRARIQTGSAFAIFAGSGSRAGAVVESSNYCDTNKCFYYRYLSFNIKWSSKDGRIKYWITIDPEFLKKKYYKNNRYLSKNWFRENPIFGFNFVFWIIVHGIADGIFKGFGTVEDILAVRPPKGRKFYIFEWNKRKKDLSFFRMVIPDGPLPQRALTFLFLQYNFTSLAQRKCFKDQLQIYRICANIANCIDSKVSEAICGQALDHQNYNIYIKYQSVLKSLDIQALVYNLEPDYKYRNMEQNMVYYRDPNTPIKLDAVSIDAFENTDKIKIINNRIHFLTFQISDQSLMHSDLDTERTSLYSKKSKLYLAWKKIFIQDWWNSAYNKYISGNKFTERNKISLFQIFKKYLPEYTRLRDSLFKKILLDSNTGRQYLDNIVKFCTNTEYMVYYPGLYPVENCCPVCFLPISE